MADCSAGGTTIDRAARAFLGAAGSGNSNGAVTAAASKHVGALLGHAAMSGMPGVAPSAAAAASGMPMMNPDYLMLPTGHVASRPPLAMGAIGPTVTQSQHPMHQHQPSHMEGQVWNGHLPPSQLHQQHHHHMQQQHHHVNPMQFQMQQQHQMQLQMQHQMAMMMQQQQQQKLFLQQQHQQQQQLKTQAAKTNVPVKQQQQQRQQDQTNVYDSWTEDWIEAELERTGLSTDTAQVSDIEGLVNHLAQAEAEYFKNNLDEDQTNMNEHTIAAIRDIATNMVRQAEQQNTQQDLGHDGIVHGASMEQLAAAWAQAEAEYEQQQQEEEDNVTVGREYTGHDGIVKGAGIEELASAWAQAEQAYDQVLLDSQVVSDFGSAEVFDEDYANLWQGDAMANQDHSTTTRPYQFVNTLSQDEMAKSPPDSVDFMAEGMKHFQEGNLKEAIRSFETELQRNDPDNATAWRMLGRCHAENDQDPEAIKCLEAAVDRDPYSPESLLALGVSYVNELNHERALENMKAWFTHNPKYAGMELPSVSTAHEEEDIYGAATGTERVSDSAFDEVRAMLEAALEFDPTDAGDVHEALGVIYNVIKDYDAAADSFRKALESRPDDYQLWNKLGATLANGNHSDQALPAYHQALQIKPKYARAWLNMAISHSNLQDHDEAARCYLQTLSLNPSAIHCWTYLRMALSSKERWNLLPLVFARDLAGFQKEFDFVLY
jgi:peroxin-5